MKSKKLQNEFSFQFKPLFHIKYLKFFKFYTDLMTFHLIIIPYREVGKNFANKYSLQSQLELVIFNFL